MDSIYNYLQTTNLPLREEIQYQIDKYNSPFRNDSGVDYDLRGYWLENKNFNPTSSNGHIGDRYKKIIHPTFSIESQYYTGQPYAVDWNSKYGELLQALGY